MDSLSLEFLYVKLEIARKEYHLSWYQLSRLSGVPRSVTVRMAQGVVPSSKDLDNLYRWLEEYGY